MRLAKLGSMAAKLPLLSPYPNPPLCPPTRQPTNPTQSQKFAKTQLVALSLRRPPAHPKATTLYCQSSHNSQHHQKSRERKLRILSRTERKEKEKKKKKKRKKGKKRKRKKKIKREKEKKVRKA